MVVRAKTLGYRLASVNINVACRTLAVPDMCNLMTTCELQRTPIMCARTRGVTPRRLSSGVTSRRLVAAFGVGVALSLVNTASGRETDSTAPAFDHSAFDAILKKYVDDRGRVDYRGFSKDSETFDRYVASLGRVSLAELGRAEKLALMINAYNAFTLRLILDYYPIESIKDIPKRKRWRHQRWRIGSETYSLDDIEHKKIRPVFGDPRIHFALVCAAVGCPKLRNEAYDPARIDEQLEDQTRYAHRNSRWFRFDRSNNIVYLTRLYQWYGGDFEKVAGSLISYAERYSPALSQTPASAKKPKIQWLDYDWSLNEWHRGE